MYDTPQRQTSRTVIYRDGDLELHGELFKPTTAANGRIALVVHEADGIGANVRRHCQMLTTQGYVAFAADMHGGGKALEDDAAQEALRLFRCDPDLLRNRVKAAFDAMLKVADATPDQAVALGYCFGGFAVLELARSGTPVRAVASFHGLLCTARPASRDTLAARIAAFTGGLDPLVPPGDIAAFQAEMTLADADWQMGIYGRALHSFTNETVGQLGDDRMRYDAEADEGSWQAMLRFFDASFKET